MWRTEDFLSHLKARTETGKTTQVQRLAADLRCANYDVCLTHEPGGTPISEQIRDMLLNPDHSEMTATTELLLYTASRAQHVSEVIKPALESGKIVISSRFADAMVVYQGYGRGLDLERINHLNQIATDGVTPDVTFVLDLLGRDWVTACPKKPRRVRPFGKRKD